MRKVDDNGLTPARRRGLEWFLAHGEVAMFDASAPSGTVRRWLEARGLIETCGTESGHGAFGFTKFRISQAGAAALKAAQ